MISAAEAERAYTSDTQHQRVIFTDASCSCGHEPYPTRDGKTFLISYRNQVPTCSRYCMLKKAQRICCGLPMDSLYAHSAHREVDS